jgi:hypothetical protein
MRAVRGRREQQCAPLRGEPKQPGRATAVARGALPRDGMKEAAERDGHPMAPPALFVKRSDGALSLALLACLTCSIPLVPSVASP